MNNLKAAVKDNKTSLAAIVVYIVGIVCILRSATIPSIICFMAESVFLIGMCIQLISKKEVSDIMEHVTEEDYLTLEQERVELSQRVEALEKELDENSKSLEGEKEALLKEKLNAEAKCMTLQSRIDELLAESKNDADKPKTQENTMDFLPPIEENESENETIDIIKIANDTIEELRPFAKSSEINIMVSTSDKSLLVRGNVSRMRILFRNIIDNSIKYMSRSGNLIITISNIGEDIFIVLKDNGNGLSEAETEHIFELNYQGSNRISGNGLGLTQAKAIVDYYGGTIYAKSNIGRGMGIYIQLPTT